MSKVKLKSTGPNGDLDPRRWVIITIRNLGAAEAQFPLPVTHNTQRIAFDRDEPVIAPAYYLDIINDTILPKYEEIRDNQGDHGHIRNNDQARLVELRYPADVVEIDDKYQTTDAIVEFAKLLRTDDCPDRYEEFKNRTRLGQVSFNRHNHEWSREMKAKLTPKSQTQKKTVGSASAG